VRCINFTGFVNALMQPDCAAILRRIEGWAVHRPSKGCGAAAAMIQDDRRELEAELARLRQEHRDLDTAIEALHHAPGSDILQVQRLKKRKLQLRDRMTFIEDQLTPDIIA
jgi:hypothetical protein